MQDPAPSLCDRLVLACEKSFRLLFTPFYESSGTTHQISYGISSYQPDEYLWLSFFSLSHLHNLLFADIPVSYPLHKKLTLSKARSLWGKYWDLLLLAQSVLACALYVLETYPITLFLTKSLFITEVLITQFFALDFVFNFFAASQKIRHLFSVWTMLDILTIIPIYISMAYGRGKSPNLTIFRFVRILRLVRILRTFKILGGLTGVKRQIITLSLILVSLVFMAAGIIQIMENDVKQQLEYRCNYINELTNWQPSCSFYQPAASNCDCDEHHCTAYYDYNDIEGQPSTVRCITLTFFKAFYFLVVTVATVGYGDISPTTDPSRAVVIVFIITSLIIIPTQVNQITSLLSLNSIFRNPYDATNNDSHIIICGHVTDWRKLERFLKEFFHPDRAFARIHDYHVLILSPIEPDDNIRSLLFSPTFDSRISYLIGSVLSIDDMVRARADIAAAVFFLCNSEATETSAKLDDAATVLRTLSAHNFNPNLECFVQVLKPEDRDILRDSGVDVILCLDEYKIVLQARNSICPGISTIIENLFHTFGGYETNSGIKSNLLPWQEEYNEGANKEIYYINLHSNYLETLSYEWALIAEGVFLEFDVMLIGVCDSISRDIIINPTRLEIEPFKYPYRFFKTYNVGVIIADEQAIANNVEAGLGDPYIIDRIVNKLILAEQDFLVRKSYNQVSSPNTLLAATHKPSVLRSTQFSISRKYSNNHSKRFSSQGSSFLSLKEIITASKARSTNADLDVVIEDDDSDFDDETLRHSGLMKESVSSYFGVKKRESRFSSIQLLSMMQNYWQNKPENQDSEEGSDKDSEEEMDNFPAAHHSPEEASADHFKSRESLNSNLARPTIRMQSRSRLFSDFNSYNQDFVRNLERLLPDDVDIGHEAQALDDANDLSNHIIVCGINAHLSLFIKELRRPLIANYDYHPIVVVSEEEPQMWDYITEFFNDVYWLKGTMTNSVDFNRTNIRNASSVVLLTSRDNVTKVEEENLDADTLFTYLKLEKYVPRDVFFTVELSCASNMSVLNSTLLRRAEGFEKEKNGNEIRRINNLKRGTFVSLRNLENENMADIINALSINQPAGSKNEQIIGRKENMIIDLESKSKSSDYWTAAETHHMLPVFASGRAFVPTTFDSLLCQGFFSMYTPLLCEKLICGQKYQTFFLVKLPSGFAGRFFVDVLRAFLSRQILILGVYRAADKGDKSILPFVYTCPAPDTVMRAKDQLYAFASPVQLKLAFEKCFNLGLKKLPGGIFSLQDAPNTDNSKDKMTSPHPEKENDTVPPPPSTFQVPSASTKSRQTHINTASSHRVSTQSNSGQGRRLAGIKVSGSPEKKLKKKPPIANPT